MIVEPQATAGGILMPMDVAEDMSSGGMTEFRPKFVRCGTVVALGEGKSASALPLEIGQQVVVSPTGGVKFLQDGKDGGAGYECGNYMCIYMCI